MNNADLQIAINREVRKQRIRRLDTMAWELTIPPSDYKALLVIFPALDDKDPQLRDQAWRFFIASDASKPYRVHDHRSKMRQSNGKEKETQGATLVDPVTQGCSGAADP